VEPIPFGTKTDRDLQRLRQRLRQRVQSRLTDILQNEPIITERRARLVIPDDWITLPSPSYSPEGPLPDGIYREDPAQHRPGDVLGRIPKRKGGGGGGSSAGDQAAEHGVELWLPETDLYDLIAEAWQLPRWVPTPTGDTSAPEWRWDQRRLVGSPARWLRRQTVRNVLRHGGGIHNEDVVYRGASYDPQPHTDAVVFLVRDISGSMALDRVTQWIRGMAFVITLWLRQRYPGVRLEFVVYDAEADRVDETAWFSRTPAGGTRLRSALDLITQLREAEYPAHRWLTYLYVWTDGDDVDPQGAVEWLATCDVGVRQVGWILLYGHSGGASLLSVQGRRWLEAHPGSPLVVVPVGSQEDIPQAIRALFTQDAGGTPV